MQPAYSTSIPVDFFTAEQKAWLSAHNCTVSLWMGSRPTFRFHGYQVWNRVAGEMVLQPAWYSVREEIEGAGFVVDFGNEEIMNRQIPGRITKRQAFRFVTVDRKAA